MEHLVTGLVGGVRRVGWVGAANDVSTKKKKRRHVPFLGSQG